jgi:hypothetical protein
MEINHQEAVFEMRAERILPEKRNGSAILTRPNFEIAPLLAGFKPCKEMCEGGGHVHESPFYDRLRDLIGPGELLLTDSVELLLEGFLHLVSHQLRTAVSTRQEPN